MNKWHQTSRSGPDINWELHHSTEKQCLIVFNSHINQEMYISSVYLNSGPTLLILSLSSVSLNVQI